MISGHCSALAAKHWNLRSLWPSCVLAILILALGIISFAPFVPRAGGWMDVLQAFREGLLGANDGQTVLDSALERLLGFIPIGFLLHRQAVLLGVREAGERAFGATVALALAMELGQGFVERHPRWEDLLLAMGAGGLGVVAGTLLPRCRAQIRAGVYLGFGTIVASALLVVPHFGLEVDGWDCGYPLVLGNELTADRAWAGSVRDLELYARSLRPEEIRRLAAGQPAGSQPQLVVGSFNSADLSTSNRSSAGQPVVSMQGERIEALCQAMLEARSFSIALRAKSGAPDQSGPARIVGMSVSPMLRNFTLAEEFGQMILRVRTPRNGANGMAIELRTRGGDLGQWHHIVATYANGVGRIYLDGEETGAPWRYFAMLTPIAGLLLPSTALAALLLFGLGAAIGFVERSWPRRLSWTLVATASLVPAAAAAITAASFGRRAAIAELAVILLVPACGWAATRLVCRARRFGVRPTPGCDEA